jgi:hypothetical protein
MARSSHSRDTQLRVGRISLVISKGQAEKLMRRRYLNKQWDISTAIIDERISVEPEDAGTANGSTGQRCAVVYNPIKISGELRDAINQQAAT